MISVSQDSSGSFVDNRETGDKGGGREIVLGDC